MFRSKTNSWPSVTLKNAPDASDCSFGGFHLGHFIFHESPVVSFSRFHMGSPHPPVSRMKGSVETDCSQALAVDRWSRLIRETPSWASGSRERLVKGARCIINIRADCGEVSVRAGLSQTLVFNN